MFCIIVCFESLSPIGSCIYFWQVVFAFRRYYYLLAFFISLLIGNLAFGLKSRIGNGQDVPPSRTGNKTLLT
ncbi:hypothetical protein BC941DRAFT_442787 [Chlamydoabsidia padenii]|nr:hypothetical protein BC941DRAFT_442787 [Chlamydoabsidia padenii]